MEKPEDRIKAWQEKAAEVLLIRTDRQADEEDYFVAGCEHVWNTYVVPLQDENKVIQDSLRASERLRAEDAMSHINEANELRNKLKVCEHLKELADDAIVTLQKENEDLREEIEMLKDDNEALIKGILGNVKKHMKH